MLNIAIMKGNIKMKDCKLRCINCSQSFRKGDIYHVVDNELEGDDETYNVSEYNTVREMNKDFEAQFEIVEEELQKPLESLTLLEVEAKYGSDCHDEIVDVIKKYKAIIPQSEIIETYKSILDIAKDAYSVLNGEVFNEDGDFLFEVNKRTYMDCKEHVLKEEIDKYESANR